MKGHASYFVGLPTRAELEGGVGGGGGFGLGGGGVQAGGLGGNTIDIATTNTKNPWVGKKLGQKHSTALGLRLGHCSG